MISLLPLGLALLFAAGAAWVVATDSRLLARRRASVVAVVAVLSSVLVGALVSPDVPVQDVGVELQATPRGLLAIAPTTSALVALIAVGLAPLSTHSPRTLSSVLLLATLSEAFLSTTHPIWLALLWLCSALVGWYALRAERADERPNRVFAVYQLASGATFGLGMALLWAGNRSSGIGLVLIGIAIREAVIPVHSWFTHFVERAPMGVVVAFAGPQLGVYAQLQLLDASWLAQADQHVAALGATTAVVAALLGVVQTRARRAVAYLIMSQSGLVAFGLENHSAAGLAGALLNWQVLAVATSGFAMVLAALESRRGPLTLGTPNGAFSQTPMLAVAFLALGLSAVGFPLTLGFIAEDLLVQGSVAEFPTLALALIAATAFNGVTVLRAFFHLFMGRRAAAGQLDMTRRERAIAGTAVLALIGLGCVPSVLLRAEEAVINGRHHAEPSNQKALVTAHPTVSVPGVRVSDE